MSDLPIHKEALGQHIIHNVIEGRDEDINWQVPDDVEVDWDGWEIEEVDHVGEGVIAVHATQDGIQVEKIRSATYNPPGKAHPAEYKNHHGTIHADAFVDWSDDPLYGDCELEIWFEGGAPSPEPNYEPYDEL